MKRTAATILLATLAIQALSETFSQAASSSADVVVDSGEAEVAIYGGTPAEQNLVVAGAKRFADVGLPLPDLDIYIHSSSAGCDGYEGFYRPGTDRDRIDICSKRTLTVLHELGHAWEHLDLTDEQRDSFMELTGTTSWADQNTDWSRRGMEVAANTVAFNLLADPANQTQITHRATDFGPFRDTDRKALATPLGVGGAAVGATLSRRQFRRRPNGRTRTTDATAQ